MRRHPGTGPWFAVMLTTLVVNCQCGNRREPDPGPNGGQGTVKIGGEDRSYSVATDETDLLILVKKSSNAGICGQMHDHAIRSTATEFSFALSRDAADSSTLQARVYAAGLVADRPEDRDQFDQTRGDRSTSGFERDIEVSTRAHLKAEEHPEILFNAHNLTTLDGTGTAPVDVTLKGTQSSFTMDATARWEGEKLIIEGTGTIDGRQHSIPEQSENFSQCVDPEMDVKMKLVLIPGATDGGLVIPDAGGTQPRVFPDDAPCGPTGFAEVRSILVRRCAGCHTDPSVGLVSTPLVTFDHFRTSTARRPEEPLYAQSLERITLDPFDAEFMPPLGSGDPVPDEEVAVVRAWVESGAHQFKCDSDGGPITPAEEDLALELPVPACGTIAYSQVAQVLDSHACIACHFEDAPGQPALNTEESGLRPANHNFYRPFNLWEASALRMKDGTMPVGSSEVPQADYELVWSYAQQEKACRDGGM